MSTRQASAHSGRIQTAEGTTTKPQRRSATPDILAELQAPRLDKGESPLQPFHKFVLGDPGVTLANVKQRAATLLAALEAPICLKPSPGIETLRRNAAVDRLRELANAANPPLALYYLTGRVITPTGSGASTALPLCPELTEGIPNPAETLIRYYQKKILDSGVLLSLQRHVTDLTTRVDSAHQPTNQLAEKRAKNEASLNPVKEACPKIDEKINLLLPYIPNFSDLRTRIASRLPEVQIELRNYHLPEVLTALRALARELSEVQKVIAATLKKRP